MPNDSLSEAKNAKNDEFYTQYADIQAEVNAYIEYNPDVFRDKTILLPCDDPEWSNFTKFFAQNFEHFGLKKLISTSYAYDSKSKQFRGDYQLTMFEQQAEQFDATKTHSRGKIFTLTRDVDNSGKINVDDLEWKYLDGDGDFRSNEVKALRDEADIIITNPPFSLFREFLAWIMDADKSFLIIGNKNAIANKDMFSYIQSNRIWIGYRAINDDMWLLVPDGQKYEKMLDGKPIKHIMACWFTNLDHGRRHEPMQLMTMADNIKFSKHNEIKEIGYIKYDNYDAIEVPYVDAIPSDYDGVMGVPITFLDKYNPEQFEILGSTQRGCHDKVPDTKKYDDFCEVTQKGVKTGSSGNKTNENANVKGNDGIHNYFVNQDGYIVHSLYSRIFIKHK